MKAIRTRYLPPTDNKGSRYKATANGVDSVTIPFDYTLEYQQIAEKAARVLCDRNGWNYEFVTGQLDNGDYCHILTNKIDH